MKKNFLAKNKYAKGFTLMEVMVSVTIFSIIVTIGMGALITIFKTLQKSRAQRQAIDSVSYVLDTMTRRIRTGSEYASADTGDSGISFTDQDGNNVSFYSSSITGATGDLQERLFMTDASRGTEQGPFDITPENFSVDDFVIELLGNDHGGTSQPLVLIHLVGTVQSGQQTSRIAVQAAVSQRLLDFPDTALVAPPSPTGAVTDAGIVKAPASPNGNGAIKNIDTPVNSE